jgi:hypothetical protein
MLGIPGLIISIVVWLTVREPRHGQLDSSSVSLQRSALAATIRFLVRQRSAIHILNRRIRCVTFEVGIDVVDAYISSAFPSYDGGTGG